MGDLMKFYLAGPIAGEDKEGEKDGGQNWRDEFKPRLEALDHEYADPAKVYTFADNSSEALTIFKSKKTTLSYAELRSWCFNNVVRKDLIMIDGCTGLIARFPKRNGYFKYGTGTCSEMFYASQTRKIPVYVILEGATITDMVETVSAFTIWEADMVFSSTEEFFRFLENGYMRNSLVDLG